MLLRILQPIKIWKSISHKKVSRSKDPTLHLEIVIRFMLSVKRLSISRTLNLSTNRVSLCKLISKIIKMMIPLIPLVSGTWKKRGFWNCQWRKRSHFRKSIIASRILVNAPTKAWKIRQTRYWRLMKILIKLSFLIRNCLKIN